MGCAHQLPRAGWLAAKARVAGAPDAAAHPQLLAHCLPRPGQNVQATALAVDAGLLLLLLVAAVALLLLLLPSRALGSMEAVRPAIDDVSSVTRILSMRAGTACC
jgi:hypothetical protein